MCKFFGVRTSRAVRKTDCQECKDKPDCTLQTNILLATTINVDGTWDVPGKVSDVELLEEAL